MNNFSYFVRPVHRVFAIILLALVTASGCGDATDSDAPKSDAPESASVTSDAPGSESPVVEFDLEGHRGARGLAPENTIPGFIVALDLGVTTLELDVVLSADTMVVVSHEPWFSSTICTYQDGTAIEKDEEKGLKISEMTYDEVARFECGLSRHPGYPEQIPVRAAKPLLSDAIRAIEKHVNMTARREVTYNIEIKSSLESDGVHYSSVDEFAQIVYHVLVEQNILDRTLVQSFDPRAIEAIRLLDRELPIALLVSNESGLEDNLVRLSFVPDVYSPSKDLVDRQLVDSVHRLGIRIIPWTVNETERMKELIALGVDGLITDYPDRGMAVLAAPPRDQSSHN